jgi:hypothetical protein
LRKFMAPIALAAAASMAVAGVAIGQTQENQYSVSNYSVNPTKAGTSKKPRAASLRFQMNVEERNNLRPATIKTFRIRLDGMRLNTNAFPGCTAARLSANRTDRVCPAGSLVGRADVKNLFGDEADPNSKVACALDLKLYNSRNNKLALWLTGNPNLPPTDPKYCPINPQTAIQANVIRRSTHISIEFTVPNNLQRPAPGLKNSLVEAKFTLNRRVRNGRPFAQTVGGCRGGRRSATVTFVPDVGPTRRAQSQARCSTG